MRALRDFNVPKIVTDDTPVFMGLIGDLFPALDVPRKRDFDFEKDLVAGALSMNLQPEPGFILKVPLFYRFILKFCYSITCLYRDIFLSLDGTTCRAVCCEAFRFHRWICWYW